MTRDLVVRESVGRELDATSDRLVRWLGAAFLVVFATSLAGGLLSDPALGDASGLLGRVSGNTTQLRFSNLFQLLTAIGIVPLAALLYALLRDANRPLALMGFGWWLGEAVMCAVSTLGVYALLALSGASAAAARPTGSNETLSRLLLGLQQNSFTALMLFFCFGALAFYYLFLKTELVPKWMAIWGLVGVVMLLTWTLASAWDPSMSLGAFSVLTMVVYVPFEPVVGLWLLISGVGSSATASSPRRGI